jgi:O-antigen ligase
MVGPARCAGSEDRTVLEYVSIVGAAVVLILLFVRPAAGLAALMVYYPFIHHAPRLPAALNAQTILITAALVVTLIRVGMRFPPVRVTAPVLAFTFVIVMGFFVAGAGVDYFDPSFDTWERFKAVKSRVFTSLLFFIVYWNMRDPSRRQQLLEGLSVGLLFVGAFAVAETLLGASGMRPEGLFGNANYTGDVLGIFLIVPLFLARAGDLSKTRRLFYLGVYGVCAISLMLSQTRAGWLAAFAGHAIWFMYERKQVAVLAAVGVLLAGTVAYPLMPEIVRSRIEGTFGGGKKIYRLGGPLDNVQLEGSAATRLVLYRTGFDIWVDSPLWGHGLDTFRYLAKPYGAKYGLIGGKTPHSLPLKLLTETGLIGIFGLMWVGMTLVLLGMRIARRKDRERALGPLLIAVAFGTLVVNLFHEDFMLSSISSGFFWSVFGVCAKCRYAPAVPAAQSSPLAAPSRLAHPEGLPA